MENKNVLNLCNEEKYFFKFFSNKSQKLTISINIFVLIGENYVSLFFKKEKNEIFYFVPGTSGVRNVIADSKLEKILNFLIELENLNDGPILKFNINIKKFEYLMDFANKNNISFLYGESKIKEIFINDILPDIEWLQFKPYDNKRYLLESSFKVKEIEIIAESKEEKLINIIFSDQNKNIFNHIYFKNNEYAKKIISLFKSFGKVTFTRSEIKDIVDKYKDLYYNLKNIKVANLDLGKDTLEKINKLATCVKRLEIFYDATLEKIITKISVKYKDEYIYLNNSIKKYKENYKNQSESDVLRDYCEEEDFFLNVLNFLDDFNDEKYEGYIVSKNKYVRLKSTIKRWKSFDNYEIIIDKSFEKHLQKTSFKLSTLNYKNNLLEISFSLPSLSDSEVIEAIKAYLNNDEYFETDKGRLINLKSIDFKSLEDELKKVNLSIYSIRKEDEGKIHLNFYNSYYLLDILQTNHNDLYKKLSHIINEAEEKANSLKIHEELKKKLHPYQFEGVKWFKKMIALNMGGILADEMGLGKTIQTIAFLDNLYNYEKIKMPSIVICPSSLIYNWNNEFCKFSKKLNVVVIDGSKENRIKIIKENANKNVIFITSYHQFARDSIEFENIHFYCSFIDEGQMIKNYLTKFTKEIKKIKSNYRFALSGTPLENNLLELWSIFDFILPGYLLSKNTYKKVFYKPFLTGDTKDLLAKINPFILRRLKKNVLDSLSEKDVKVIKINQKYEEKDFYQKEFSKIKHSLQLLKNNDFLNVGNKHLIVLNAISFLRIISSSPFIKNPKFETSEKLEYSINLIKSIILQKQKVLIFTQFVKNIPFFEKNFIKHNIKYDIINGKTNKKERFEIAEDFNNNEDINVLIISLKAGSLGLNLTSANNVILYDIWWNKAVENQAIDRVHRIGQKRGVNVFKLIMKNTIEEKVFDLQNKKQEIIDIVLNNATEKQDIDFDFLLTLLD